MPALDQLKPDTKFMGLFIGRSGCGKKAAAATFPKPILFLDFDGRIRGLLGCPWLLENGMLPKGFGDVEQYPPKNKEGEYSFTKVNDKLESLQGLANIGQIPYKTLYCGSLTGAAFNFLQDANQLSHQKGKGMKMGPLNMTGPQDYKFESNAAKQFLSFLRWIRDHPTGIPNVIVGTHVVPKWGKPGMEDDNLETAVDKGQSDDLMKKINEKYQYLQNIVVGEKLALTDKLAEEVQIYFDHIFKFDKKMLLGYDQPKHYVQFRSEIARTSYASLPNGEIDITGKAFYPGMMRLAGFEPENGVGK